MKVAEPDPYYRFTDTAKRARNTDIEITDRRLRPRKTNTDTDKPHTVTDNTDIQHTENNSTADRKRRMRLEQQQAYRQQIQTQQKEYEDYVKQKHPVANDSDSDTTDDEDIDPDHPGYKIVSRVILNDLRVRVVPMENLHYMVHAVQTIETAMPGDKIDMSYNFRQPSLKLALSSFEKDKWIAAMELENKSLKDKGTYRVVYYDKGNVPYTLKSMWVLTKKHDEKGKLICYKARCVIKGYTQEHGVHYDETFAPVVSTVALRTCMAIGVNTRAIFYKLDIKNAFSQADIGDYPLHVKCIPGFPAPQRPGKVAVLTCNKAWYGCKQGPRNWFQKLCKIFKSYGKDGVKWIISNADRCCLKLVVHGKVAIRAATVVDDVMFIVQRDMEDYYHHFIEYVKTHVHSPSDVKTEREPKSFLNLKITRLSDGGILINQPVFIDKILQVTNMEKSKPLQTFNPTGRMEFSKDDCPKTAKEKEEMEKYPVRNRNFTIFIINDKTCYHKISLGSLLHCIESWQSSLEKHPADHQVP